MYDFQSRVPLDHVLELYKNIRDGAGLTGQNLILAGAILGETGTLLKGGMRLPVVTLADVTHDDLMTKLSELENVSQADAQFDITPYLPYILMLIEWLMKRSRA